MKSIRTSVFVLSAFALLFGQSAANGQLKIDCKSVEERVATAVEGKPENVLTIVEDALVAYSGCVDTIVKAAIEASKADAATVKQIVLVAVTTAEKEAPKIAEAAVAAAPDHADAVREAFAEAFEKKKAATPETQSIAKTESKQANAEVKKAVASSSVASGEQEQSYAAESRNDVQSQQHQHSSQPGKAVIGEVEFSGKGVVAESGKGIVDDSGKTVIYENGVNYLNGGKSAVGSGKEPAFDNGYHLGASGSDGSQGKTFSYGPVDLAGVYLIPPVASASAVEEEDEKIRVVRRFKTRNRTVIRSIPMSPTSP